MNNVSQIGDRGVAGQTVFVSGAGAGIGRAVAEGLAAAGAHLALLDLDLASLETLAQSITANGLRVTCHKGDVANAEDIGAAVLAAAQHHGWLDGAVNNAGILGATAVLHEYPSDTFQRVLDVNVMGVVNAMQAQLPVMIGQGQGSIVNIASAAGIIGWVRHSAYVASKHAVVGLTKTAALEYASKGIRINSVSPAFIYTDLTSDLFEAPGAHDAAVAQHPIGRLGQPHEVAEAVMWLLSGRSSFAVGSNLVIDGASTID